jgi:hypothetical protein
LSDVEAGSGAVGAATTLFAGVGVELVGETIVEFGVDETLGAVCAADSAGRGAIRCRLRMNFITEKPITSTRTPMISGIGEIRSRLEGRTTGPLTGFGAGFS